MKSIVGLVMSVITGLFLAVGVIVFTKLIGAGSNMLGFTEWTFRYYMLCLGVCSVLLISSKPVRQFWPFMMIFLVAISMVIGVGFDAFSGEHGGQDQLGQIHANLAAMGMLAAKVVMYVAPGGLTAFYAFLAYDGVSNATAHNPIK